MMIFSLTNHVTGMMGMPRRVYDASYGGSPIAAQWAQWTAISAVGGVILFVSAALFVAVVASTLSGRATEPAGVEFAEAYESNARRGLWDRFGFWTAIAVLLVLAAYAWPIAHHLSMPRFGSPGFKPF
jgi:cytochrome c oxidase subunit 1